MLAAGFRQLELISSLLCWQGEVRGDNYSLIFPIDSFLLVFTPVTVSHSAQALPPLSILPSSFLSLLFSSRYSHSALSTAAAVTPENVLKM